MIRKLYIIVLALSAFGALSAQDVGIGIDTPNASAKLDITDSNRGLLMPRMARQQ